jgi:hypothetical protein
MTPAAKQIATRWIRVNPLPITFTSFSIMTRRVGAVDAVNMVVLLSETSPSLPSLGVAG